MKEVVVEDHSRGERSLRRWKDRVKEYICGLESPSDLVVIMQILTFLSLPISSLGKKSVFIFLSFILFLIFSLIFSSWNKRRYEY